jgi:hypothetical protein
MNSQASAGKAGKPICLTASPSEYLVYPACKEVNNSTMCNLMGPQGDLLANPIFESLCQSLYEEEKWQRLLLL